MRKLYNLVVLAIDLILLVVIIRSVGAEANSDTLTERPAESGTYAVMPESQNLAEPDNNVSQGIPSEDVPPGGYEEYIGMEDFEWYTSNISENWFPEEAIQFNEFQRMKGKWRAYIKFDPMNEAGRRQDMLLHIYISGDEENVTAEYDWYWYQHLNEPEGYYDDSENSYYYGAYKDGEIHAEGAGDVVFRYFYEWDGEEYAIGVMHSQAGVPAILCMMR